MKFRNLLAAVAVVLLAGCSTPKDVVYYQDINPGKIMTATYPARIKVQPYDKLSIIVSCQEQKLTNLLNKITANVRAGQEGSNSSNNGELAGYTVDSNGDIDFPVLGKLHVAGMTREELCDFIKKNIQDNELAKEPIVTVEFLNLGVSVTGEVNSPGRINIIKDNMTIIDVLTMAGDLTINGNRENIMVLRTEDGVQKAYSVNLLSGNDVISSPVYYVRQDDVIYVEPNANRIRQSTVNGNTVQTYTFWMSLITFLMSVAVLVTK